jgi:hypothetical protein
LAAAVDAALSAGVDCAPNTTTVERAAVAANVSCASAEACIAQSPENKISIKRNNSFISPSKNFSLDCSSQKLRKYAEHPRRAQGNSRHAPRAIDAGWDLCSRGMFTLVVPNPAERMAKMMRTARRTGAFLGAFDEAICHAKGVAASIDWSRSLLGRST